MRLRMQGASEASRSAGCAPVTTPYTSVGVGA